jgi:hypothetical protein
MLKVDQQIKPQLNKKAKILVEIVIVACSKYKSRKCIWKSIIKEMTIKDITKQQTSDFIMKIDICSRVPLILQSSC